MSGSYSFGPRREDADKAAPRRTAVVDFVSPPGRLERLSKDDPEALGELMGLYWGPLTAYGERMLHCRDSAEDVVQETFVRLWQVRATLSVGGSERALLYEIARNLTLKRLRHTAVRRRTEFDLGEFLGRRPKTPFEQVVTEEYRRFFEEALALLPERRRESFVLLRYQGLSLEETAHVMGLSKQTVANHAVLAMKQLKDLLRRYEEV